MNDFDGRNGNGYQPKPGQKMGAPPGAEAKLYAERDIMEQGTYYTRHVMAMTAEGLHDKSSIAAELAHRDGLIDELQGEVKRLIAEAEDHSAPQVAVPEGWKLVPVIRQMEPADEGEAVRRGGRLD